MKIKKNHTFYQILIGLLFFLPPLLIVSHDVLFGNINFWYDPARDFLLGWGNLQKFTLIGPTSGIPGIFYGPYWIWLISAAQLVSKDPSIVIFLILTIPYFTIFPFILYKFKKIFKIETLIILWLIFVFSKGIYYAENPWNPHLAPLLFLVLTYLIVFTDFTKKGFQKHLKTLLIGITTGLIVNFHISFGLGVFGGVFIFFLIIFLRNIYVAKQKRKGIFISLFQQIALFLTGIFITVLPFIAFEMRHSFGQIKTAVNLLTAQGAVVGVKGLSKELIIQNFFEITSSLLKIPTVLGNIILLGGITHLIFQLKIKKVKLNEHEIKLIVLLLSVCMEILLLYLTSKNPVWSYHFIGVEVVFLLVIGLIINNFFILRKIIFILAIYGLVINVIHIPASFSANQLTSHSLATQKYIVNIIHNDAEKSEYTVYAYSPSIYSYEYSYLFKWLANKDVHFDPSMNPPDLKHVYLIIPQVSSEIEENFINYRTTEKKYVTVKTWSIPDKTKIIKRVKKS